MTKKEMMLIQLEMIEEISRMPLYYSLEVGFRHNELTNKEKLDRYSDSCNHINILVQNIINDMKNL